MLPLHSARHGAPPSPPRPALTRAVLLAVGTAAFGGLALLPSETPAPLRIVAAAASSPIQLAAAVPSAAFSKDLDTVPGAQAVRERLVAQRAEATARASRSRKAAAVAKEKARPTCVRPNAGGLTSDYGPRWGRMHNGVDYAGAHGSAVYAAADGVVRSAGYEGGYGNMITIRHKGGVVTAYAHLSKIFAYGGKVRAGDVIGRVGNTGHSTGPHLHFEVRVGGSVPINPLAWLRGCGKA